MDELYLHLKESKVKNLFLIIQYMQQEGYDSDVLLQNDAMDVIQLHMASSLAERQMKEYLYDYKRVLFSSFYIDNNENTIQ